MTQRIQIVVALLLTITALVIFVSPAVPTAPTTLRMRHSVTPLLLTVPVAAMQPVRAILWMPVREALVNAHSPDVLDLTSARLC